MEYCKSCLIPDTRPNGRFNAEGICMPCIAAGHDFRDDFEVRFRELKFLLKSLAGQRGKKRWQCVVGVSGGKDSTRQALWVREKLGLNPLLVSVVYPPRQVSQVGVDNLSNLIRLGFDTLALGPAPDLSRQLVREAFLKFGNWAKATEMCLFSGVPKIALAKGIRLILWGENPALSVGDSGTLGSSIWDGSNLINSNTLAGGNLDWFIEVASNSNRLPMYHYPDAVVLKKEKINTVFLGPAWKDWSAEINSEVAFVHGFRHRLAPPDETGEFLGTQMVDEDYFLVNMMIKYFKYGFSFATEQANFMIRRGQITREEAIHFVEKYDGLCDDKYISSFCEYIQITETDFWLNVKRFANRDIFDLSGSRPVKRFKVGYKLHHA